jgi:hypothetical protein
MALNEYGYARVTTDVDVLLTAEGLAALKARVLGRGYVEKFPGSRGLRDTEHGVDIDVILTGGFPGDGKPKPISFPDPAVVGERGEHGAFLPLAPRSTSIPNRSRERSRRAATRGASTRRAAKAHSRRAGVFFSLPPPRRRTTKRA